MSMEVRQLRIDAEQAVAQRHRLAARRAAAATVGRRALATTWLLVAGLVAAALVLVGSAPGALAAGDAFRITKVDTSTPEAPRVEFVLAADGAAAPRIELVEGERTIRPEGVFPGTIGSTTGSERPVIVLTLDTSESMAGERIATAREAAKSFLAEAGPTDLVALVGFGGSAEVLVEPTTDRAALERAIDAMVLTNGTSTYDAVIAASGLFPAEGSNNVILLMSDGVEKGSNATRAEALAAASDAGARIVSVGITGRGFEPQGLTALSTPTGGSYHEVRRTADLEPLFAELGQQLLGTWWLEYRTRHDSARPVELTLRTSDGRTASRELRLPVISTADGEVVLSGPRPAAPPEPLVPLPGGTAGKLLAIAPFMGIFVLWFLSRLTAPNRVSLEKRISPYVASGAGFDPLAAEAAAPGARGSLVQRVFARTERMFGTSERFRRYQQALDGANLPLRPVELFWARVVAAILFALVGLVVGGAIGLVAGAAIGWALPMVVVRVKASRRRKAFDAQLADVLATMAASLKAGHSFNQSIQSVVKEAGDPVAGEFQRAMTEAGLGLPIEEALESMAERLGSEDFRFVVTTVNIQRTVGGSLAEILEMVGDTVRGRQQFRKKVQAITSMGRASMWVLLAMPVAMAGILSMMNAEYMAPLWETSAGHWMIGGGLFLMTLGYFACNRIVTVKT